MTDLDAIKEKITPILKRNDVEFAGIFGSYARGEARKDSDVDILVRFAGRPKFRVYLELDEGLRQALGRDVDLITEGSINKFLRPHIDRDLQIIYGQR